MGLREVVETVETRNMHNFFAPLADDLGKFFSGKTIFYLFALSLSWHNFESIIIYYF